jgi:DNA-binding NtrC family response regulator
MAKILTIGLDQSVALPLSRALGTERHDIRHKPKTTRIDDLLNADIIFVSGEGKQYLLLLKKVREVAPALPFVVVTSVPETSDWLDALEAGATDYCAAPFEPRHLNWLMETALATPRTVAA